MIIVPVLHSHKEHVRRFEKPVCIYHTEDCLPAPVSRGFLLDDSALLAALSLFLADFLGSIIGLM
jgi:hypothetical protein